MKSSPSKSKKIPQANSQAIIMQQTETNVTKLKFQQKSNLKDNCQIEKFFKKLRNRIDDKATNTYISDKKNRTTIKETNRTQKEKNLKGENYELQSKKIKNLKTETSGIQEIKFQKVGQQLIKQKKVKQAQQEQEQQQDDNSLQYIYSELKKQFQNLQNNYVQSRQENKKLNEELQNEKKNMYQKFNIALKEKQQRFHIALVEKQQRFHIALKEKQQRFHIALKEKQLQIQQISQSKNCMQQIFKNNLRQKELYIQKISQSKSSMQQILKNNLRQKELYIQKISQSKSSMQKDLNNALNQNRSLKRQKIDIEAKFELLQKDIQQTKKNYVKTLEKIDQLHKEKEYVVQKYENTLKYQRQKAIKKYKKNKEIKKKVATEINKLCDSDEENQ